MTGGVGVVNAGVGLVQPTFVTGGVGVINRGVGFVNTGIGAVI